MTGLGTATVIRGDARRLPLPDDSVDLIVTSPPYFALRSYQDGGEHYPGQIGSETTPIEFLDALIECTCEWMRVLKPSGSLWVNLGDKYEGSGGNSGHTDPAAGKGQKTAVYRNARAYTVPPKSLMGIPWRYAIGCIDQLGLILRAEVIWSKPNGLPESVTDRVRRSHEQWFHFTLQPRYFSAVDEVREAHDKATYGRQSVGRAFNAIRNGDHNDNAAHLDGNPLGKLPGSVREIPSEPLTVPNHLGVDHFAAFPTAWPRWIIQGWSPAGICVECGEGRRPVAEGGGYDPVMLARRGTASQAYSYETASGKPSPLLSVNLSGPEKNRYRIPHQITGYVCACPTPDAPTRPSLVVDPFGGTGTTALVAKALGRHGISVDLSHDYSRLAQWRTTDPAQLAKVCGVDKPPVQTSGQIDLFEETA